MLLVLVRTSDFLAFSLWLQRGCHRSRVYIYIGSWEKGQCLVYLSFQESKSFSRSFHHICAYILLSSIVWGGQSKQVAFIMKMGKGERAGPVGQPQNS